MRSLFKPGDIVVVCAVGGWDLPNFLARIRWQEFARCEEHGDPVYRCEFELDGSQLDGSFCQSVLAYPN